MQVPCCVTDGMRAAMSNASLACPAAKALAMPNLMQLPGQPQQAGVVAVEVKPKAGFLPDFATIHPDNDVKRHVSRFALQQTLKLRQV